VCITPSSGFAELLPGAADAAGPQMDASFSSAHPLTEEPTPVRDGLVLLRRAGSRPPRPGCRTAPSCPRIFLHQVRPEQKLHSSRRQAVAA